MRRYVLIVRGDYDAVVYYGPSVQSCQLFAERSGYKPEQTVIHDTNTDIYQITP